MRYTVTVNGKVSPLPDSMSIDWVAASPPDRITSFSGSGIPFASEQQAFEGAAQSGVACVSETGHFSVAIIAPNSYHVNSSEVPLSPRLFVFWKSNRVAHKMSIPIPNASVPGRSLRDPVTTRDTAFPDIQTQESYLRDGGYSLEA